MKTRIDARIEAAKKFNPKNLCNFLIKAADGVVIVDRAKAIKNSEDERLFVVTMNADYRWDYSCHEYSTVYLQIDGEEIVGGIYNTKTHEKTTQRKIASSFSGSVARQYVYSATTMKKMREQINNA